MSQIQLSEDERGLLCSGITIDEVLALRKLSPVVKEDDAILSAALADSELAAAVALSATVSDETELSRSIAASMLASPIVDPRECGKDDELAMVTALSMQLSLTDPELSSTSDDAVLAAAIEESARDSAAGTGKLEADEVALLQRYGLSRGHISAEDLAEATTANISAAAVCISRYVGARLLAGPTNAADWHASRALSHQSRDRIAATDEVAALRASELTAVLDRARRRAEGVSGTVLLGDSIKTTIL